MALRCAADDPTGQLFNGVLAMDPNLAKDTCVMTGMFSQLDPSKPNDVVDLLQQLAKSCTTIDEWVINQGHVINCLDKLSSDLLILVQQSQDIAKPFTSIGEDQLSPFIQWYKQATDNTNKVRCIFADDAHKRSIIAAIRMEHLRNKCLGEKFADDSFVFIPESHHLGLMRPDVFRRQMDDLLASL